MTHPSVEKNGLGPVPASVLAACVLGGLVLMAPGPRTREAVLALVVIAVSQAALQAMGQSRIVEVASTTPLGVLMRAVYLTASTERTWWLLGAASVAACVLGVTIYGPIRRGYPRPARPLVIVALLAFELALPVGILGSPHAVQVTWGVGLVMALAALAPLMVRAAIRLRGSPPRTSGQATTSPEEGAGPQDPASELGSVGPGELGPKAKDIS